MYQVVVLPPPEPLREIEEMRRLHDPAFHRVPAHVSVLPPFEPWDAHMVERFDELRCGPAFRARFGPPQPVGRALCLPLVEGADGASSLQQAVAAALLGPVAPPPASAPSLRVGVFVSDAELELARRSLATLPAPPAFTVGAVTLLYEDVRGLWHEVRRRALRG